MVARYCAFIRTIGSVYREAESVMEGRSTTVPLLKNQQNSGNRFLLVRFPLYRAAYRAWEIEWRAQITFLYISSESIDETKGNVREIAMLLRHTHDSLKETMLMLCARVVHARDRHVSAKTGQASLRNVLVSDITRTINNCICELSILPLKHIASVPEHFARARSAMCKSCIKHGLHVYARARLSAKL